MPEELDLSAYRAHGLQPGETPIVDPAGDNGSGSGSGSASASASAGAGAGEGPIVPDETLVLQLMAMGFSGNDNKPFTTSPLINQQSTFATQFLALFLDLSSVDSLYHDTTCYTP